MDGKSLERVTKQELEQLEEDYEKCTHLVSKEAIRESIRIREEALLHLSSQIKKP
jgi:hypothetical protein